MMRTIPRRFFAIVPTALILYAIFAVCYHSPAKAQNSRLFEEAAAASTKADEAWIKTNDVDARVGRSELVVQGLQSKVGELSDRTSRMEATVESSNRLGMGTMGGVVVISILQALGFVKKRKVGEED